MMRKLHIYTDLGVKLTFRRGDCVGVDGATVDAEVLGIFTRVLMSRRLFRVGRKEEIARGH